MFGLSPGKLLVLLVLIGIVWVGFRFTARVDAIRRGVREELRRRQQGQRPPRKLDAEDLVKCAICGSYVAARSAVACSRPDCPYGR
ncbi:MAG TPA: hypothetical protein VN668_14915 [Stellaceae bacterium]|nr:hypothetical protein [Stellaceae bacterium]